MYGRFTDGARKVMQLANQEAQRFQHQYIGTEHILLGLIKEGTGVAAIVLKNLDIDLPRIRLEVEKVVQAGVPTLTPEEFYQIPRAKKVIEFAIEEARSLNHNYVGTEHLLLGLFREQEGVAAQVLTYLGLKLEDVRAEVRSLLGQRSGPPTPMLYFEAGIQDMPEEIRPVIEELDAPLGQLNREKEAAVGEHDFEKAADLRDQADKLRRKKDAVLRDWVAKHPISESWLSWKDNTVAKLALTISRQRRWQDLPMLADALENGSCTDPDILSHFRRPGEHGSRCWMIDLLLANAFRAP